MRFKKVFTFAALASSLFAISFNVLADNEIYVISKGSQHQYWKAVELGCNKAAEELHTQIVFTGPKTESDIKGQVELFDEALDNHPKAICLASLDTIALSDRLKQAEKEDIPVIGFDSGVPNAPVGSVKANASTNNSLAGSLVAQKIYELMADKIDKAQKPVRIAVLAQDNNAFSITSRTKGFIFQMSNLFDLDKIEVEGHRAYQVKNDNPKIIIEVAIPSSVNFEEGVKLAQNVLAKDDLIAVFATNEFSANTLLKANESFNKLGSDKVIAIGFDSGARQQQAIRDGLFIGSVSQNPIKIGYEAIRLANDAAAGEVITDINIGSIWYDKKNIDRPEIKVFLYN